jgi:hypothetical protein
VPAVVSRGGVVRVDFDHTGEPGMALLTSLITVYPADVQDCYTCHPVPKIPAYADYLFSAVNGVARGTDGRLHFQPLKVFINELKQDFSHLKNTTDLEREYLQEMLDLSRRGPPPS